MCQDEHRHSGFEPTTEVAWAFNQSISDGFDQAGMADV
jgi:hypothetical protein